MLMSGINMIRDGPLMIWGALGHRICVEFFFLTNRQLSFFFFQVVELSFFSFRVVELNFFSLGE